MIIGHINSKWSMPTKLALISAIFLLPSLIQLWVYTDNKLAEIGVIDREIAGAKLASAIWAGMPSDQNARSAGGNLAALSDTADSLGAQSSITAFQNARTAHDQVRIGVDALEQVASASGLNVDPAPDAYYAQEVFVQSLPAIKAILADMQEALGKPANIDSVRTLDAMLTRAAGRFNVSMHKLVNASENGDAKRAIGDRSEQFLAQIGDIHTRIKAADDQHIAIGADVQSLVANANGAIDDLASDAGNLFSRIAATHASNSRAALYRTLALLLAATAAAIAMVWLISRGISVRLANLVDAMDHISRKDLNVEIPCMSDSNENGQIAQALSRFKEAVIQNKAMTDAAVDAAKQQQEQSDHYAHEHERFMDAFTSAADRIARGDFSHRIIEKVIQEYEPIISQMNLMMGQLEEAQKSKIEAEKQINLVVSALGSSLSELADGNLEASLDIDVEPEFAKLKADFNSAASELKSTIALVKKGAGSIKLGTEEISQASDDLSRRTENQAASLEETAAAVKEITDTVNKTARGATHARETVSVAKTDAEKSGEVVRKAIDAMNAIETSSKQISQIIGVIDEIAFQTNLLALNAGVEAARAGDAGRGFAVVASEVRALAQRSAEAAKEIKGLISASTGQVAQGVQLVGETGQALTRIVTQVAAINSIVTDIATSANEQAHGLEQVNTAVNEMDQVTQQNAAMVEEATAATQTLAQQTEELSRLVSRFKTGDDSVVDIASRREPARPAARSIRTAATMKKAANGSAHHAKSAQGADAGWEEF